MGENYFFRGTTDEQERLAIIDLLEQMNVADISCYTFNDPDFIYFTYNKNGEKLIQFDEYEILKHVFIENPHPGFTELKQPQHEPLFKKGDWVNWKNTLVGLVTEVLINPGGSYSYCIGNMVWGTEKEFKKAPNPIKNQEKINNITNGKIKVGT